MILAFFILLMACQNTPTDEYVINKDSEIFEQAMEEENNNQCIGFPDSWETSYKKYNGNLEVIIDAEVIVNKDVLNYAVAEIKPYYIPIDQANKIINAIYGTTDVYLAITDMTKSEIEERIIDIKADIQGANSNNDQSKVEYLQSVIDYLYEKLENAPDEVTLYKYNGEYQIIKEDGYEHHSIVLRENPLDKYTPALEIHNTLESKYSNGYDSYVLYDDLSKETYYISDDTSSIKFDENPIFETQDAENAVKIANAFLEEIGVKSRYLVDMLATTSGYGNNDISGYVMIYAREFNETIIQPYVQFGGSLYNNKIVNEEDYIDPFINESLLIEVSNEEIIRVDWSNIYEINSIMKENITLIEFSQLMESVENQLAVKYAYAENNQLEYSLYIDKIILTYAVEPIKDKKYEYMLIPVWAFYGGYDYGEGQELSDGSVLEGKQPELISLLTINAVDGSIISGK